MNNIEDMVKLHNLAIECAEEILEGEPLEQFKNKCREKFFNKVSEIQKRCEKNIG